jgi:ectoine hydroxylase-related dioxygenase (phytanoyl-CoA dioxygenase family)
MLPAAIEHRCEFVSPAWLDAVRAFLSDAVATRRELQALRFSLCEAFDDAPPHVAATQAGLVPQEGASASRVAWYLRIDCGTVTVAAGEAQDVDLHISGDYQHVLAQAQTVYAAGEDAVVRARRELAHRASGRVGQVNQVGQVGQAGKREPLQRRGALPDDPALARLLADLHDHMAARTVENPDLAHRLERLGLARQASDLAEHGFCVIERAVTEAFADELRPHVHREVRDHHPLTTNGLMLRHRLFEEVALHPLACAVAQSAVGRGMLLGAMSGTVKGAGRGAIDIHADYPLVSEPYPAYALIAVACWALEDWTVEAGPTWVIPGSHRLQRAPTAADVRDGAVPILMPKGSIALWSHGVWHWQGDRSLPGERVAIHVTYNRVFVRQLDDFGALDEARLARNPPAFSTLMGLDDPFGKSGHRGHDGRRFAHAGRLLKDDFARGVRVPGGLAG